MEATRMIVLWCKPRSSREIRIRVPDFFSAVYFSRETLPNQKRNGKSCHQFAGDLETDSRRGRTQPTSTGLWPRASRQEVAVIPDSHAVVDPNAVVIKPGAPTYAQYPTGMLGDLGQQGNPPRDPKNGWCSSWFPLQPQTRGY